MDLRTIIKKVWSYKWVFRSIFSTVYFNFHYLPFKQAVHLPILLYKPTFIKLKGKIILTGKPKFGSIQLGRYRVPLYPNTGIVWENKGGTVIFEGKANIGNASALSIFKDASLKLGNYFSATAAFKLVCVESVQIGESVEFGWDCLVTDTNFHPLVKKEDNSFNSPTKGINIGADCWFATRCSVMPGSNIPKRCVFSIGTVVFHRSNFQSYRIHRSLSEKLEISNTDVYRDFRGKNDYV